MFTLKIFPRTIQELSSFQLHTLSIAFFGVDINRLKGLKKIFFYVTFCSFSFVLAFFYIVNLYLGVKYSDSAIYFLIYLYFFVYMIFFSISGIYLLYRFKDIHESCIDLSNLYSTKCDPTGASKMAKVSISRLSKKTSFYTLLIMANCLSYAPAVVSGIWLNVFYGEEYEPLAPRNFPLSRNEKALIFYLETFGFAYSYTFSVSYMLWSLTFSEVVKTQVEVIKNICSEFGSSVDLVEIAKEHQVLLKKVQTFLSVFEPIVEVRMLMGSINIVMELYMLEKHIEGVSTSGLITDILDGFCQVSINCYIGTTITSSIDELTSAFYDIDWWTKDTKQQKVLAIMMCGSQISPGSKVFFKSIEVQLPTVVTILQMCYSSYTALKYLEKM